MKKTSWIFVLIVLVLLVGCSTPSALHCLGVDEAKAVGILEPDASASDENTKICLTTEQMNKLNITTQVFDN